MVVILNLSAATPTNSFQQTLRPSNAFFYMKKTVGCGNIQNIWYLAKIPLISTHHAPEKLEKLFNRWRWLQKREKKTSAQELQHRKDFSDHLGLLFDIASPGWEKEISTDRLKDGDEKEEDLNFLVDQRGT